MSAWPISRTVLSACFTLSLLACTQEVREEPPTDCSMQDGYEFKPIFLVDVNGMPETVGNWYASGDVNTEVVADPITGAAESPSYATKADFVGDVCGHTTGKKFTFGQNHDWGAVGGRWAAIAESERNASEYEGFSFWGLSEYDHSVELLLQDSTSFYVETSPTCIPEAIAPPPPNGQAPDPMAPKLPNPDFVDENGVPRANGCGSGFARQLVMSRWWTLYTIPFDEFFQVTRDPRIKPDGINRSDIWQFSFRVPKDSLVEVSFVNFAWYKKKQ